MIGVRSTEGDGGRGRGVGGMWQKEVGESQNWLNAPICRKAWSGLGSAPVRNQPIDWLLPLTSSSRPWWLRRRITSPLGGPALHPFSSIVSFLCCSLSQSMCFGFFPITGSSGFKQDVCASAALLCLHPLSVFWFIFEFVFALVLQLE